MTDTTVIDILEQALLVNVESIDIRFQLGKLYLEREDAKRAEAHFRTALTLAPDSNEIKIELSRSYLLQGKNSVVLVILEELLAEDEPDAMALKLAAETYFKTGSDESARKCYIKAIEKEPSLADRRIDEKLGLMEDTSKSQVGVTYDNSYVENDEDDRIPEFSNDVPELPQDKTMLLEKSDISFTDVGGMEAVKEEIGLKIIHPLNHPDIYQAYGKSVGGGILMYGPPGCGKTYLARATAGEVNASFMNIGLNDVLDMYLGQSEQNLHNLFETARNAKPAVLFFDEVDALGAKRSDMRQSAGRQLINQFLSELDGVSTDNDGLLILAATNSPWHLDSAFRRPGRFDRIIFIPPPDLKARQSILELLLTNKPIVDKIDTAKVAKKTADYSGADLKALVDVAIESRLGEAMKTGKPSPITTKDLLAATKKINPTVKEWFATAKNYALYSNQNGLYDDILTYLNLKK